MNMPRTCRLLLALAPNDFPLGHVAQPREQHGLIQRQRGAADSDGEQGLAAAAAAAALESVSQMRVRMREMKLELLRGIKTPAAEAAGE